MNDGRKDDGADGRAPMKERWDLLVWGPLRDVVRVLTHGAVKYGPRNWLHVTDHRGRYFAAAMRHLAAWERGEAVDQESGLPHLAHAQACLMFLAARDDEPVSQPEAPPARRPAVPPRDRAAALRARSNQRRGR